MGCRCVDAPAPKKCSFIIGMIPIPASFRREARMVLKTLKVSLSVLAAATSVASLFAVSWVGLALLGY
jgi:hypothetical protein